MAFFRGMSLLLIFLCQILYVALKYPPANENEAYQAFLAQREHAEAAQHPADNDKKDPFEPNPSGGENDGIMKNYAQPFFNRQAHSKAHFFLTSIYRHKEGSSTFQHYPVLPDHLQQASDLSPHLTGTFGTDPDVRVHDRYGQPLSLFTLSSLTKDNVSPMGLKRADILPPLLPDPTDKFTLLNLAKMSYNDYYRPNDTKNHYPVDPFYEV